MIAIYSDLLVANFDHGYDPFFAVSGGGAELHAHLQLVDALKVRPRDRLQKFLVAFAIGLFGLDGDTEFVAGGLAFQGLFQTRNQVAYTLDIGQRLPIFGAVEFGTLIIGQGVVDGGDFLAGNLHGGSFILELEARSRQKIPALSAKEGELGN